MDINIALINIIETMINSDFELNIVNIIIDYKDNMEWEDIIFSYKENWDFISKHQYLQEKFIECYSDKVNWDLISKYQKLSNDFIKKNISKIFYLNKNNENCEEELKTIIKHKNLMWKNIYKNKCLYTYEFVDNNIEFINWEHISNNKCLTLGFMGRYSTYLNWKKISSNNINLTTLFIIQNKNKIVWSSFMKNHFHSNFYKYNLIDDIFTSDFIEHRNITEEEIQENIYSYYNIFLNMRRKNVVKVCKKLKIKNINRKTKNDLALEVFKKYF